jgi:hypothetical protein
LGDVMRLLRTVFGVSEKHRMFQADVLRWKCFGPHPFWEGSRGYALRYKGEMAAFVCLVPIRFLTVAGTVPGCNFIDWVASKAVPGAGIMLRRHIQGLIGTMINTGGTEDARQVLPKIGYQARGERYTYTRVVRPWRHFQAHRKDWKSPLRLARAYRELWRAAPANGRALSARRVDNFDGVPAEVFPDPSITRQVVCARTPESLGYFMACPAAKMEAYLLERDHTPTGYFLLSRVGSECRIADLWVRSPDRQDWAEAYATAIAAARTDPHTTAVQGAACSPLETDVLERSGYRRTDTEPLFVLDPDRRLGDQSDLDIGLLEDDQFYWSRDCA